MKVQIKGRCYQVGDEVTANQIISQPRWSEACPGDWLFENLIPGAEKKAGAFRASGCSIVAAGRNFGCGGKSNDYTVLALKNADVELVIAEEFNRIFYRLAIDLGLTVVTCPGISSFCFAGDTLLCDLSEGTVTREEDGAQLKIKPPSALAFDILSAGGLLSYYKTMRDQGKTLFNNK